MFRQVLTQGGFARLNVRRACQFIGISRQAWYQGKALDQARQTQAQQVLTAVRDLRRRQPRLGTRKLHYLLQTQADEVFSHPE